MTKVPRIAWDEDTAGKGSLDITGSSQRLEDYGAIWYLLSMDIGILFQLGLGLDLCLGSNLWLYQYNYMPKP